MIEPFISVIIPVYSNSAERSLMLSRAINSVLSQTYSNYEIIIVNDGSSVPLAIEIREEIKHQIINIPNCGASLARNYGVCASKGDWIAFLDSDDEWLPNKLQREVDYLNKNPELNILQSEDIWIRDGVRINPKKHLLKKEGDIFEDSLKRCMISVSAAMVKKSLLIDVGLFDIDLPACEDYDLWLRITLKHKVGLLKEKLMIRYAGHPGQLSFRYPLMDRFRVQSVLKLVEDNLNKASLDIGTKDKLQAATVVASKKINILITGAKKRDKPIDEYLIYKKKLSVLMKKLESISSNDM